jgi:hypothetical protein
MEYLRWEGKIPDASDLLKIWSKGELIQGALNFKTLFDILLHPDESYDFRVFIPFPFYFSGWGILKLYLRKWIFNWLLYRMYRVAVFIAVYFICTFHFLGDFLSY